RSEDTTFVWFFSLAEGARIHLAGSVALETEGMFFIFFLSTDKRCRKVVNLRPRNHAPATDRVLRSASEMPPNGEIDPYALRIDRQGSQPRSSSWGDLGFNSNRFGIRKRAECCGRFVNN